MNHRTTFILSTYLALGFVGSAVDPVFAEGSSPFNMMNPSRWFGGRSRDYDDYYNPGYGPYGGPGYGMPYGPPGSPPYGSPPAYGYGAPTAPQTYAPAQTPPPPVSPRETDDASASRIRELEERIRELETSRQQAPQPGTPSPQESNSYAAPQSPPAASTWQGGNNIPAPQTAPAPPAWQGSTDYNQPPPQAPMPQPWQRPGRRDPQAATEPGKGTSSWPDAGSTAEMPASPAPEPGGDAPEQQHRFRPF